MMVSPRGDFASLSAQGASLRAPFDDPAFDDDAELAARELSDDPIEEGDDADFDFEFAKVIWADGDFTPKAIAVPLKNDDVYDR